MAQTVEQTSAASRAAPPLESGAPPVAAPPRSDGASQWSGAQPAMSPAVGMPVAKPRRGRAVFVLPVLAIVLIVGATLGYRYVQDQRLYVSTDNAMVSGALIQVGGLNAGRISSVSKDIGDTVSKDETVATITLPSSEGATPDGTPRMIIRGTGDQQVPVRSPSDGVVVQRQGNPGDTVPVGAPILTVVEPGRLWVMAQIKETAIGRVRVGQEVLVRSDALGETLTGRVLAVDRASSATFSLMPQSNASGNYTKVTQLVPIKIAVDYGMRPLMLGTSVEVKIRVGE